MPMLTLIDSEIPRKLIRASTRMKSSATGTSGTETNASRYRPAKARATALEEEMPEATTAKATMKVKKGIR